jgi:hypothetical protein
VPIQSIVLPSNFQTYHIIHNVHGEVTIPNDYKVAVSILFIHFSVHAYLICPMALCHATTGKEYVAANSLECTIAMYGPIYGLISSDTFTTCFCAISSPKDHRWPRDVGV